MVSPATKSVLPPDNVPEAYRASSTLQAPTVILVGEPGRDDWSPAEKVEWASIKRGRDNTPTTASLTASLSVDDLGAAGSIGGRHFYHLLNEFGPNTLVRIFQAGADEQGRDDYPLFEGWPVAVPIRSDPRNQTIDFELTDRAFVAMDGDERAQVTGQFLRRNRLATWKPWRPNHVRIEARPVVFNEGGQPNRSAEHYRYRRDTDPKPKPSVPILLAERIPLFTDAADKSARHSLLAADSDDTPMPVTLALGELIGRVRTSGGIVALDADNLLDILSAAWHSRLDASTWYGGAPAGNGPITGSYTPTADRLYAVPFFAAQATTWGTVGVRVTTAEAGKKFKLGVYDVSSGSSGDPGTRLLETAEQVLDSTGSIEVAISLALDAGKHFLAVRADSSTAVFGAQNRQNCRLEGSADLTSTPRTMRYTDSGTYAANGIPATWPGSTTINSAPNYS